MVILENFPKFYQDAYPAEAVGEKMHRTIKHGVLQSKIRGRKDQVKELFHESVRWAVKNDFELHTPVAAGIGNQAIFYKISNQIGFRFAPEKVDRIKHDFMLPNFQKIENYDFELTNEIVPLADTSHVTQRDIQTLLEAIRENKQTICNDPYTYNFGFYKKNLRVIDPGALKWNPFYEWVVEAR